MPSLRAWLAVALAGWASQAQAQPSDPHEPMAWAVPEVVVQASAPRFWKLTRAGRTVYVLGIINPMPKQLPWNTAPVGRVLAKVDRLILPPTLTGTLALGETHLSGGRLLDDELPADLRGRLQSLLQRLGRNPNSLQHDKAAWAAIELESDLRTAGPVTGREPLNTLRHLAHDHHVQEMAGPHHDVAPAVREYLAQPEDKGVEILAAAVKAVENQLDHHEQIGKAWASGNLHDLGVFGGQDAGMLTLLESTQSGAAIGAQADRDVVAAVEAAMQLPGASIMILDLKAFARREGVVDALRGKGVDVEEQTD